MRKKIVAGNWKMNNTLSEAVFLIENILSMLNTSNNIVKIIIPPFPYLESIYSKIRKFLPSSLIPLQRVVRLRYLCRVNVREICVNLLCLLQECLIQLIYKSGLILLIPPILSIKFGSSHQQVQQNLRFSPAAKLGFSSHLADPEEQESFPVRVILCSG